jgi:hypothetical protein
MILGVWLPSDVINCIGVVPLFIGIHKAREAFLDEEVASKDHVEVSDLTDPSENTSISNRKVCSAVTSTDDDNLPIVITVVNGVGYNSVDDVEMSKDVPELKELEDGEPNALSEFFKVHCSDGLDPFVLEVNC